MNWLVVNLLLHFLIGAHGAQTTGRGFVGMDGDGNLQLQSPAGGQLMVDGVALMSKLADLEALISQQQSTIVQQQITISQLNATVATQQSIIATNNQGSGISSELATAFANLRSNLGLLFNGTIRTIDSTGNVGSHTSLALATAGFPVISYYDNTNSNLNLAVCADATCSSGTTIRTIDSTGDVGQYTSLALTAAGFPVISYYDKTNNDLKLAVCTDATCSSGTTIRTIASTGLYTSLALTAAGFPVISYFDDANQDLKLAACADTTCSSGTTIRTIHSVGVIGYYTSLALTTAGFPVISYHDAGDRDLKLAVCADATCSPGTTIIRTIDSTGDVGHYTSLALTAAGLPVISYYDATNSDLKLAVCANATCSSGTTIRTIDSLGNVGSHTSLVLTPAGFPVISYYDGANNHLKLAVCADATCSSGTIIRTIDSTGIVGEYPSLTLTTGGFPVISYYDNTNGGLKLAVCANATCF